MHLFHTRNFQNMAGCVFDWRKMSRKIIDGVKTHECLWVIRRGSAVTGERFLFSLGRQSIMGRIETTYDPLRDLTIFKLAGKVSAVDLFDCLANYCSGAVTLLNLWDDTETDLTAITASEIEDFAEYASHLAEARKSGKTAIVFGRAFEFGLGRMFETYLELAGLPIEVHLCRSIDDARKWLGVGCGPD